MNYKANGNELVIMDNKIKFDLPIFKIEEFEKGVIVLLDYPRGNTSKDGMNELYAISRDGNLIWKMENVTGIIGKQKPDPVVDFRILNDSIIAIDFSSRKYIVDIENGKIINFHTGRW